MNYPRHFNVPPLVVVHGDATVDDEQVLERTDRTALDRLLLKEMHHSLLTTMRSAADYLKPGIVQPDISLPYVNEHVDDDPLRPAGWYVMSLSRIYVYALGISNAFRLFQAKNP